METMIPGDGDANEDAELMLRAVRGDCHAFGRLYAKYLPLIRRYLASLDRHGGSVADMTQEVFVRVWAARQRYVRRSSFAAYLLGYANRVFLEERSLRTRRRDLMGRLRRADYRRPVAPAGPQAEVERHEMEHRLERAILQLTAEQRHALRLYYCERLSLREAARAAGCTQKCFEGRLLRARRRLRNLMPGFEEPLRDR